jgi:LPXTG-motif cell wall-anchored protein
LQRALLRRDQELATMRSELERLRQTSAPTLSERAESAQSAPAPATPATPATQSVPVENAVSATVSAAPGAAANTAALESQSEQPWALFEPSPLAWLGLALLIGGAVLIGIKRRRASLLAAQAPSRKDLEASESALVEGVVLNHLPDLSDFSGLGLNAPSKSGAGSGPSQIAKAPP